MQHAPDGYLRGPSTGDVPPGAPVGLGSLSQELRAWMETILPAGRRRKVLVIFERTAPNNQQYLAAGRDISTAIVSAYADDLQTEVHLSAVNSPLRFGSGRFDMVVYAAGSAPIAESIRELGRATSEFTSLLSVIVPNMASFGSRGTYVSRSAVDGPPPTSHDMPAHSLRESLTAWGFQVISETYLGRPYPAVPGTDVPTSVPEKACAFVAAVARVNTGLPGADPTSDGTRDLPTTGTELESLREQIRILGNALQEADQRSARWRSRALGAEKRAAQLSKQVSQLDELLLEVRRGLQSYKDRFESGLAQYRSQRAWKIMLAIRKAYSLAMSKGLAAKCQAVGVLASMPFRHADFDDQELHFPVIEQYLPKGVLGVSGGSPRYKLPLQRKYDVIILAIIDFDFRFQRPQQIAVEYARRGHRVFWVCANRFLPANSSAPFALRKVRDNLWEADLRGECVDLYRCELPETLQRSLRDSFEALSKECSSSENLILVQLPFWRRAALDLKQSTGGVIAYDCMDDWRSFHNLGEYNRLEEEPLIREADVLAVTAKKLVERFENSGANPILVRNGVDYDLFVNSAPVVPQWNAKGPVIGYVGAIADWIDLDLIVEVARLRPSYTFVLIGQVFGRDTSDLAALPNVRLLGHQPYENIPGFLRLFDVCHIPFLLNAVTAATDPVKFYEYLSLGKPVVATDMEELRLFADLVYIGHGPVDYAIKLDQALAENTPERERRRMAFARENTWRARVNVMDEAVSAAFPKVTVIIVTYNSSEFIGHCLDSICRNASYPNYEIVVVDNASTDGTVEILRKHSRMRPNLRCEYLDVNRGFAGANNVGARLATGEYLIFLNADTLTTPGWIGRLLRHLRRDTTIGLICPVTNFAGNEAKISTDYRDMREMEEFAVELASRCRGAWTDIPMVPLFCAMMERSLYEKTGGMDEQYEIGMFEDDDLSVAVRSLGLITVAAEDCFVHHFGQGSFSKLAPEEYNRIFESNRRRFERKWSVEWTRHKLRPGVRPPFEDVRFVPGQFCTAGVEDAPDLELTFPHPSAEAQARVSSHTA